MRLSLLRSAGAQMKYPALTEYTLIQIHSSEITSQARSPVLFIWPPVPAQALFLFLRSGCQPSTKNHHKKPQVLSVCYEVQGTFLSFGPIFMISGSMESSR